MSLSTYTHLHIKNYKILQNKMSLDIMPICLEIISFEWSLIFPFMDFKALSLNTRNLLAEISWNIQHIGYQCLLVFGLSRSPCDRKDSFLVIRYPGCFMDLITHFHLQFNSFSWHVAFMLIQSLQFERHKFIKMSGVVTFW